MTPDQIRDAIAASEELQALVPDTVALAAALSAGRTRNKPVERSDFAVWVGATGLRAVIEDHAANAESPLRSVSLVLKDFLLGAANGIDLALPGNQTMLAAWQAQGALSQAQVDELLALGTEPDPVSEFAVRGAIFADDGELLA